jgi:hypothetical protein
MKKTLSLVAGLVLALSLSSFAAGLGAQVVTGLTGADGGRSFGFGGGVIYDLPVGPVSIVPGALFMYRMLGEGTIGEATAKTSEMGVDIPVLVRYEIAGTGAFVQAGPQVGFAFGTDTEVCVEGRCAQLSDFGLKFNRNAFEFGLDFGAGYNINEQMTVDFRYYLGLTEFGEYEYGGAKMKASGNLYQMLVGFAYKF